MVAGQRVRAYRTRIRCLRSSPTLLRHPHHTERMSPHGTSLWLALVRLARVQVLPNLEVFGQDLNIAPGECRLKDELG
jgi:hypothetical protein